MSVESEILRIQHNIASAYTAVSKKGGEVPLQPTSANLEAAIMTIPYSMDWLNIAMTSDSTPAPYQASAKSYVSQYGGAWNAFDGDASTFWHSGVNDTPNWIKIDLGRKARVDSFKILQRPDSNGPGQAPKIFTFKGSDDGETWTTIASYTEIPNGGLYQLTDEVQYRYYMLDGIYSTRNDAVCIAEWMFHGSFGEYEPDTGGVTMDQVNDAIDAKLEAYAPMENYSAKEQRVGTWIDGKPVFRKTLDVTVGNANGAWCAIPGTNTMNIDKIVHLYGYVNAYDGSGVICIPNADAIFKLMGGGLSFTASANQSNTNMVITLEYTKLAGTAD